MGNACIKKQLEKDKNTEKSKPKKQSKKKTQDLEVYDREKSIYDLTGSELSRLAVYDDYFADERTFHFDGHSIVLKDEMLAEALKQLPEHKRNIIIRSYFMGMTDEEIATEFNVVRQTISKKRAKILAELKKHLSEEATNG